jgi:hypothetical protein
VSCFGLVWGAVYLVSGVTMWVLGRCGGFLLGLRNAVSFVGYSFYALDL